MVGVVSGVRPTISVDGPTEIDRGYYELRVNWKADALLAMSVEELERFKAAMATLRELAGA